MLLHIDLMGSHQFFISTYKQYLFNHCVFSLPYTGASTNYQFEVLVFLAVQVCNNRNPKYQGNADIHNLVHVHYSQNRDYMVHSQ